MKFLIANLELVLTFVGLLVIFTVASFLGTNRPDYWPVLAFTAVGVGVLHGLLFWLVRRRQREVRRKTLTEAQQMLKDVINNQLAVIQMAREIHPDDNTAMEKANQRITRSIGLISEALQNISEESLKRWRSKYGNRINEDS